MFSGSVCSKLIGVFVSVGCFSVYAQTGISEVDTMHQGVTVDDSSAKGNQSASPVPMEQEPSGQTENSLSVEPGTAAGGTTQSPQEQVIENNQIQPATAAPQSTTVSPTSSENMNEAIDKPDPISPKYGGIGFNIGVLLYFPGEINELVSDIYNEFKRGYTVLYEIGEPQMITGTPIKIKGVIYPVPYLGIEPYAEALWSGKSITVSGSLSKDEWVNLFYFDGGVNLWLRLSPEKRVSFKLGGGFGGGYSILSVTGDLGDMTLSGPGYGGNILAGLDITFRKIALNIDFTVPVHVINFTQRDGSLDFYGSGSIVGSLTNDTYNYPEKFLFVGFEFRPGITFKF